MLKAFMALFPFTATFFLSHTMHGMYWHS